MSAAIQIDKLSKRYPGTKEYALSDLSLQVQPGEVYGFLGANGAGKSTTIRTLLNFIQPSGGHATILGKDVVRDSVAIKQHIGYLAGDVALYDKMSGAQFLRYMAGLQPARNPRYVRELVKIFDADPRKPLRNLSKGNRQKFGLIQAFMHEPRVLILDEPTSGLDPLMQEEFFKLIKKIKAGGASVFVSSHNLAEVQRMCDRVGFIRGGQLVAEQSIAELTATAAQTFDVTFAGPAPLEHLHRLRGKVTVLTPNRVTIHIQGGLAPFLQLLGRTSVIRLDKPEVNLEEEFLQFYRRASREEEK